MDELVTVDLPEEITDLIHDLGIKAAEGIPNGVDIITAASIIVEPMLKEYINEWQKS